MEEQPSGGTDKRAKGVEKVAFSEATMASDSEAVVTDAPMAGPLAAMMIGLGKSKKMTTWVSGSWANRWNPLCMACIMGRVHPFSFLGLFMVMVVTPLRGEDTKRMSAGPVLGGGEAGGAVIEREPRPVHGHRVRTTCGSPGIRLTPRIIHMMRS
ncbi:hypothetical protein TCAL_16227 [Tigriopus californicus]|uniref:Uncharacterized protein n=1 Tax=Tigriopus californicus TaxID=6832 RepID=A0A553P4G9_TIGCA|nr:hypothetical protein TCAL_16227 [Tigriopus californicus]